MERPIDEHWETEGGKPNLQTTKITLWNRESINKADQRGRQN